MKRQLFLLFLTIMAMVLIACGGSEPPEPTATPIPPTPTPDPAAIVREAGAAMSSLASVQFDIQRSGGPAYIDADGLFNINQAVGQYAAPDSAAAALDVSGPGLNIKVETVAIGKEQWLTNFLNQQWEKLPAGFGFNPAVLFGPQGWQAILAENVVAVSPLREEQLEGHDFYVIDATVEGERVRAVTANAAGSEEPVVLTLWIDPVTHYIHQATFSTPSKGAEPSDWLLKFSAFNEPVTIEPPIK